jgi:quinol monooxygenase YgiN
MSSRVERTDRRAFLTGAARAGVAAALALGTRPAHAAYEGGHVITAATFIHGIPGREADLEAHLLSLSAATRAEPGCIGYDLYRSTSTPSEFLRLERWKSSADLEAHTRMPHLRASFEKRAREGWTTQITVWKRVPEDLT